MIAEATAPHPAPTVLPADAFFMVSRAAAAGLAADVVGFTGYEETRAGHFRQFETASLIVPMIVSFGAPFSIGLGRLPDSRDRIDTFAAGLFAGPVVIDSFGRSACVQVDFTPRGARRFFGLPLAELAASMVPLEDVLGPAATRLRERLGEEPDWARRLDLTEAFVGARLAARPAIAPTLERAFTHLTASHGRTRIAAIADELDCSRKHLAETFRREFGLGPKTVGRLLRFRRAVALARDGTDGWADIALAAGYADQAHMSRDFTVFAGAPPSQWKRRIA